MSNRQAVMAALILALACCLVMWLLEDFRQRKMISDFKTALEKLPTYLPDARGIDAT